MLFMVHGTYGASDITTLVGKGMGTNMTLVVHGLLMEADEGVPDVLDGSFKILGPGMHLTGMVRIMYFPDGAGMP